jgi:hypothetical protein
MGRQLFTVQATFVIANRGVVACLGLTPGDGETFRIGDPLELRRPDGTVLQTRIAGIAVNVGPEGGHDVLFPPEVSREDVTVGTQVWSGVG